MNNQITFEGTKNKAFRKVVSFLVKYKFSGKVGFCFISSVMCLSVFSMLFMVVGCSMNSLCCLFKLRKYFLNIFYIIIEF